MPYQTIIRGKTYNIEDYSNLQLIQLRDWTQDPYNNEKQSQAAFLIKEIIIPEIKDEDKIIKAASNDLYFFLLDVEELLEVISDVVVSFYQRRLDNPKNDNDRAKRKEYERSISEAKGVQTDLNKISKDAVSEGISDTSAVREVDRKIVEEAIAVRKEMNKEEKIKQKGLSEAMGDEEKITKEEKLKKLKEEMARLEDEISHKHF